MKNVVLAMVVLAIAFVVISHIAGMHTMPGNPRYVAVGSTSMVGEQSYPMWINGAYKS